MFAIHYALRLPRHRCRNIHIYVVRLSDNSVGAGGPLMVLKLISRVLNIVGGPGGLHRLPRCDSLIGIASHGRSRRVVRPGPLRHPIRRTATLKTGSLSRGLHECPGEYPIQKSSVCVELSRISRVLLVSTQMRRETGENFKWTICQINMGLPRQSVHVGEMAARVFEKARAV